jgi:hypothetical protein
MDYPKTINVVGVVVILNDFDHLPLFARAALL